MAHLKSVFLGWLGLRRDKPPEVPPRSTVVRNLADAQSALASLDITCWLTDGTLLGYFREGDIIEHDRDVDLGLRIEDYSDEIVPEFQKRGFRLEYVLGERKRGLELSFMRHGVKVDLFFFYPEGGKLWHGAWLGVDKGRKRKLIKYYYQPFGLKEVDFLGGRFNVPADTLKYVVTKYGEGWSRPVRDWDWALGPANAVETDVILKRNRKKIVR
jgi:hypothetical protein